MRLFDMDSEEDYLLDGKYKVATPCAPGVNVTEIVKCENSKNNQGWDSFYGGYWCGQHLEYITDATYYCGAGIPKEEEESMEEENMRIGDIVFVHGIIDEIRNDCIIIKNTGGYFGTSKDEIVHYSQLMKNDIIKCKECEFFKDDYICTADGWDLSATHYPKVDADGFCHRAKHKEGVK
jgi:hypothetical protein